jgi:hypothetical protein
VEILFFQFNDSNSSNSKNVTLYIGGREIGFDLTGSLSFGCKYVFTILLFSRENDRFFYRFFL